MDERAAEGQASMSNAETAQETKPAPDKDSGGCICTLIKNQSQLLSGKERVSPVNVAGCVPGSWEGCQERRGTEAEGEHGQAGLRSHRLDGGARRPGNTEKCPCLDHRARRKAAPG